MLHLSSCALGGAQIKNNMKTLHNILLGALALMAVACGSDSKGSDPVVEPRPTTPTALKTVHLGLSNAEIANPERGFYNLLETNSTDPVTLQALKKIRNDGKTLVQLVYYLPEYRTSDLPESFTTKVEADLDRVREVGMKAILRFAYTSDQNGSDAPMSTILRHLDQIKPILHHKVGVIACVQAGFIGAWGEWYYSSNHLNNTTAYNQVISKWLEVLPEERCVQVRTPKYKQDFVGSSNPLTLETAFKNTPIARIGHHNDAFMTDDTNMGTYQDVDKDKRYVAQDALYVPLGGETTKPSGAKMASGKEALAEIQTLHWSFLNDGYYKPLLDNWKTGGYLNQMKKLLGYRLYVSKAEFSEQNAPGSDLVLNLTMGNAGTASMYNARPAVIVLVQEGTNSEYEAVSGIDLRTIQPETTTTFKLTFKLPSTIAEGKYKVMMWLPDGNHELKNLPAYAVQLANNNAWNSATGYNNLGISINIAQSKDAKAGTSSITFVKKK